MSASDVIFAFKSDVIGQNVGFSGFDIGLSAKDYLQNASYPTISSGGGNKSILTGYTANNNAKMENLFTDAKDWWSNTKKELKNNENIKSLKEKISDVCTYPMINNTDDTFFAFPENDIKSLKEDSSIGLIDGIRRSSSPYSHDGGINPVTGQGYKISDGYSVTITKIDENGNTVYHYEPKNEIPWTHPILRAIAEASYELKEFSSFEDWEKSSEAGWLEKEEFKKATGR